jgi:hypothetical protein
MFPSSCCEPLQAFVAMPRVEVNASLDKVPAYIFLLEIYQTLYHFYSSTHCPAKSKRTNQYEFSQLRSYTIHPTVK